MRVVLSFCIGLLAAFSGGLAARAQETTDLADTLLLAQDAPRLRGAITNPADKATAQATSMTFRIGRRAGSNGCGLDCAEFIYAEGEIQRDTAIAFAIVWNRLKRKDLPVFIHSPGGSLEGGLDLGRVFRKLGVTAAVGRMKQQDCASAPNACTQTDRYTGVSVFAENVEKGSCNSACVYTFAGAAARYVTPDSTVGIHQFFVAREDDRRRRPKDSYTREDFGNLQRTVSEVAAYLVEMGVNVELLAMAAEVNSHTIRRLTRPEMAELKLTSAVNSYAQLPARAPVEAPPRRESPRSAAPVAPQTEIPSFASIEAEKSWPMVMRDGQPWLVLSMPSQSRRFGAISNEVAIGCASDSRRFTAMFREIVPERSREQQDASVVIGTRNFGDRLSPATKVSAPQGGITRENALSAEANGVLVVEVTSSATAGYPMRLEFPGSGLKSGIETLERACKH